MALDLFLNNSIFKHVALTTVVVASLAAFTSNKASADPLTGAFIAGVGGALAAEYRQRNEQIAARQTNSTDRIIARNTGASPRAIRRHGLFGGRNSVFRKPLG